MPIRNDSQERLCLLASGLPACSGLENASPAPLPDISNSTALDRVASFLQPNDVASGLRLACKGAAARFRQPATNTVHLSHPVNPSFFAAHWSNSDAWRCLSLRQRQQLLCLVASSGELSNLELVCDRADCPLTPDVLSAAARSSQLDTCRWLRTARACPWDASVWCAAAEGGSLAVCEWLLQQQRQQQQQHQADQQHQQQQQRAHGKQGALAWEDSALVAAAAKGHLHVCRWLLAHGCPWHESAPGHAACHGHVSVTDALLAHAASHSPPLHVHLHHLLCGAAQGCPLPDLQRYLATRLTTGEAADSLSDREREEVVAAAAASFTPDWQAKVAWLLSHPTAPASEGDVLSGEGQGGGGCPVGSGYPRNLCAESWLEWGDMLKVPAAAQRLAWLQRQCGVTWPRQELAHAAALAGDTETLLYIIEAAGGTARALYGGLMHEAARAGHLGVLRLLRDRGCCVEGAVCAAARGGHLEVVQWLLEEGCATEQQRSAALTAGCFSSAAASGSLPLLSWLHARGCPADDGAVLAAARGGCSGEVLAWLHGRGCPMGDDGGPFLEAGVNGDLAALRTLRALGCPWAPDTAERAVFDEHLMRGCSTQVLDWFVSEGFPLDWRAAAEAAKWREDPAVCAWVRQQQHRQLHRQLAGMSAGAGGGVGAQGRSGLASGRKSGGSNHGRQGSHQGAVVKAGSRGSAYSMEQQQQQQQQQESRDASGSQHGGAGCEKAGQGRQVFVGAVQMEVRDVDRDKGGGEKGWLVGGGGRKGHASALSCGSQGGGALEVDEGCMAGLVVWLRAVAGVLWGGATAEERAALRGTRGVY